MPLRLSPVGVTVRQIILKVSREISRHRFLEIVIARLRMVTMVSPQRLASVNDRCADDDRDEKNRQAQSEYRHCDDSAFETLALESYRPRLHKSAVLIVLM